jgi:cyclopropane fatty-acyl-phospholipid synthase-like methyltransferase
MLEQRYRTDEHIQKVPDWHTEESPWKARHIARLLERNHLQPSTICEVGCGFGEVLKLMQEQMSQDCEFWGYEISPVALEHARERANDRLHFKLADMTQEQDVFFDLLLILDVVEHVENYLGFLQQIRTKGTYKIFQVPLDLSVQTVLRGKVLLWLRDSWGHIHYFTREMFLRSLIDCGYEILDYTYTSSSVELPTHVLQTKLMRAPRKLLYALNKDLTARVLGGYRLMVLAR